MPESVLTVSSAGLMFVVSVGHGDTLLPPGYLPSLTAIYPFLMVLHEDEVNKSQSVNADCF